MTKLRIGIVGLGGIAQKAYLPIFSQAERWELVGGFSPTLSKAQAVCDRYRMQAFARLDELAQQCDCLLYTSNFFYSRFCGALFHVGAVCHQAFRIQRERC